MRRKFKYTFTRKEETEGGFSSLVLPAARCCCFWYLRVSLFSGKGKQKAGSERLVLWQCFFRSAAL